MNKRYMDFVPARGKKLEPKPVKRPEVPKKPVVITKSAMPVMGRAEKAVAKPAEKTLAKSVSRIEAKKDAKLGIVEDLGVRGGSSVSARHFEEKRSEVRELKAKKVGIREEKKVSSAEKARGLKTKVDETFKTPKTQFINQDKIEKRPLSKNVYRKTVVAKEDVQGPVTIIAKPEKSAKISLVLTIIITIILGAAAGTVAFLLLPK